MENQEINIQTNNQSTWPGNIEVQKKNQKKKIVYLVLAAFLVVGSALGSFYFTQNLNQASVPTAPESEPQAAGGCTNNPGQCKAGKERCVNGVCKPIPPTPTGYGENYTCTTTNCPAPCFKCNASKTSCISLGCEGVSSVGITGTLIATKSIKQPPDLGLCTKLKTDTGCAIEDCHCTGGDACDSVECGVSGSIDLRQSCSNQGRSWCVNMYGKGMTCCAEGYTCHSSGKGCEFTGKKVTVTNTKTTATATIPPTATLTVTVTTTVTTTVTQTVAPTPTDEVTPTEEPTPEPTIADCNQKCSSNDNCSSGLTCDSESGRCRKAACAEEKDCSCPKPRKTDAPTSEITQIAAQPTVLKEAGILDFPGIAVFGSGLLLTVIGILLAL